MADEIRDLLTQKTTAKIVIDLIETQGRTFLDSEIKELLPQIPNPIFIDYNGVLSDYQSAINPFAPEFIASLKALGFTPVIVSTNQMAPSIMRYRLDQAGVNTEDVPIFTRLIWSVVLEDDFDKIRKNIAHLFGKDVYLVDDNPQILFQFGTEFQFNTIPLWVESHMDAIDMMGDVMAPEDISEKPLSLVQVLEMLKGKEL